jgi:hypothetical protein
MQRTYAKNALARWANMDVIKNLCAMRVFLNVMSVANNYTREVINAVERAEAMTIAMTMIAK